MDLSRYSRQVVYEGLGRAGQEKLLASRVAVAGVGALGTVIAERLCRAGLGFIRLIDRDTVDLSNLQRQTLFDEEDVKRQSPKAAAARKHLRKINSQVRIEAAAADINSANIDDLLGGMDLILDGSDNMELRQLINEYSVKTGIPWIYGAAIRASGASMNIIPGRTPCLRCLYTETPPPGSFPTCASAGVLNMITGLIANIQAAEALKILTASLALREGLFLADLRQNSMELIPVERNPRCPVCVEHRYDLLNTLPGPSAAPICGKDAVQINPGPGRFLELAALAEKLKPAGKVEYSRFMLQFDDGRVSFQVFPDGRAIIQHTTGEAAAKAVYSEYIGF
jgi:adenylyltransferase/sulfurtransferase